MGGIARTGCGISVMLALVVGRCAVGVEPDAPAVEFVTVPTEDVQAGGPEYDFRVSRFEIRNDQFVAFLNDALTNRTNERGAYLYFDSVSGDVFINTGADGEIGAGAGGRSILLFSPAVAGQIAFAGGAYQIVTSPQDYGAFPVSGVSWYGAVKYCNWFTLSFGLPPTERAYLESTSSRPFGWRPAVSTLTDAEWAVRDLTNAERDELLEKLGFRLPMDGGVDGSGPYNEWHKVASARDAGGTMLFDALYGCGRNVIGPADANYLASEDPFEPGPSPVGYFDGINLLEDGVTPTTDTQNGYGVYDLSGNVWEWLQDQSPVDPLARRNRGGSWLNSATALAVALGAKRSTGATVDSTGFRVVQAVTRPLVVTPYIGLTASGPWGGPYDDPQSGDAVYRLINLTGEAVPFTVISDMPWVFIDPLAGLVPRGGAVDVAVAILPTCEDGLSVGVNEATVTILDDQGKTAADRTVTLSVSEPLTVMPAGAYEATMPLGGFPQPSNALYTFASGSDSDVAWSATWADTTAVPAGVPWLTIDGGASSSGTVPAQGVWPVIVAADAAVAQALPAGDYTAEVRLADECTGESFVRAVTLSVQAPFEVTPTEDAGSSGVLGGPFSPASHRFTLSNVVNDAVTWVAALCVEPVGFDTCTAPVAPFWLELDQTGGFLDAGTSATITASISAAAMTHGVGDYAVTVRFTDANRGFVVDRRVTLAVTGLLVEPTEEREFRGPLGGPFAPSSLTYTLHNNTAIPELDWSAAVEMEALPGELAGLEWLDVSPHSGVILEIGGTDLLAVTLTGDAALLPKGIYRGHVTISANNTTAERTVSLVVGGEAFSVQMAMVPPNDVQAGGPLYHYRIGKFEVTNAEYARFLNDARRHATSARGHYLYHDTDSGSVYINDDVNGAEGVDAPSATLSTLLYDASLGQIGFDAGLDDPYVVAPGYEAHPVVGVSWYGAAKFCNWMTLIQGMGPSAIVYTESTSAEGWAPVPFDPTVAGGNLAGFRLPTDGGAPTAGPRNEWYKAASRKGEGVTGDAVFGAIYGFGRDVLTAADANYLNSGESDPNAATPVGFYDGINTLADGTITLDTDNGYGLYDVTGNVAEWGHALDDSGAVRLGVTHGGHFNSGETFDTLTTTGRSTVPAEVTLRFTGLRVAQSLEPAPLVLSYDVDGMRAEGPVGGPYEPDSFSVTLSHDGAYTLDDMSISLSSAGGWLAFEGLPPRQVPPATAVDVALQFDEATDFLSVSPAPPGAMRLIPARDRQTGGPAYDFWIAPTEVTNDQFVAFLNNCLADVRLAAPTALSSYMYFDLDSGSVYINDNEAGAEGTDAPTASLATLLYDAGVGRIGFDGLLYVVDSGFDDHPVVGVSWYGAVKFCNWLTLIEGLPAELRAYAEGPEVTAWRPVTAGSDALTDGQRRLLVRTTIGYRLPMDDGAANTDPSVDEPDAYNEWYKAATRRLDADGFAAFDAPYGFGRDVLGDTDANFFGSSESTEEGSAPVGLFDGTHLLADGETLTSPNYNRYGLYDLTGNVAEWMQDYYVAGDPALRAVRGGSWRDARDEPVLLNATRSGLPADSVSDFTGFRVVRGTGHVATIAVADRIADVTRTGHIILDLHEPLVVDSRERLAVSGPFCSDFAVGGHGFSMRVTNVSAAAIPWTVSVDQNWVDAVAADGSQSGTLDGGGDQAIQINVAVNAAANVLPPGDHAARVTLVDTLTQQSSVREVYLHVENPTRIQPPDPLPALEGFWADELDSLPAVSFTLGRCDACTDDCVLEYDVQTSASWLTLEPGDQLTGTLPGAGESVVIQAQVNESANALAPGDYTAPITISLIDPATGTGPDPAQRSLVLTIKDPIVVSSEPLYWDVGCSFDPADPPSRRYTLTNRHATDEIGVTIDVDVDWIDVDRAAATLLPGESAVVTLALTEDAIPAPGQYPVVLTVYDVLTRHEQSIEAIVTVAEDFCVTPLTPVRAAARLGGLPSPPSAVFEVTNAADATGAARIWTASADAAWVTLNGAGSAGGTLPDGASRSLVITFDLSQLPPMPPGSREHTFVAELTIEGGSDVSPLTRALSMTVVDPWFDPASQLVAAASTQAGGPDYNFMMGRYHTTNREFSAFLNDALANIRDGSPTARSEYLYFDVDSGDVYINDVRVGAEGADAPSASRSTLLYDATVGRIQFAADSYVVQAGFERHPVVGVSWYGAVKYCNWLTLDQGMPAEQRCYTEDTSGSLAGWHPVAISTADWAGCDLDDAQRALLVAGCRGYRLPMDDGFNNTPDPSIDTADAYNEWYKAAAWTGAGRHTVYGFGRDVLDEADGADANYASDGAPFADTTPVGFYGIDGDRVWDDPVFGWGDPAVPSVPVQDTDNAFGLYDMTGNVFQWMQGRFTACPDTFDRRTVRGGNWSRRADSPSLRTDHRTFADADFVHEGIGFRVLRVLPMLGDADQDGDIDAADLGASTTCLTGPAGELMPGCTIYDLDADGDFDLRDVAALQSAFTGSR